MRMAIRDAGIGPEQVQYVNAHGTSTDVNDRVETLACKEVFGERAHFVAVPHWAQPDKSHAFREGFLEHYIDAGLVDVVPAAPAPAPRPEH